VTRTLVTGATGFVGGACTRSLASSCPDLHVCARTPPRVALPESVTFHAVDLFDPPAVRALIERVRPSRLLHLAWIATPGSYWDSPENAAWVVHSQRLLDAFADQGGTRVAVAGTCAEYDWAMPPPYDEVRSPTGPTGAYAHAKERLRRWTEQYAAETGVSVTWARLFFLYGSGEHQSRLVPSLTSNLLRGRSVEITSGDDVRDYLHVDDASAALVGLLEKGLPGVVNVGSGEGVTIRSVAERIASILGRPDLLRSGTPAPARGNAVIANTERIRRDLGWEPAIGLDSGLRETIMWWKDRLGS
jgi:nucleoside-diphosphate-sugar epimerase